jgi:dynein heavy chain
LSRAFQKEYHTPDDVRDKVQMHLDALDQTAAEIPHNITIGPFMLMTETTRQSLCKKRRALANALLEMFARELYVREENVRPHAIFPT